MRSLRNIVPRFIKKTLYQGFERYIHKPSIARLNNVTLVDQPLVLISQIQRSGGTLLSQLFDGHPQCFVHPKELIWGYPTKRDWPSLNIFDKPKQLFEKLDQNWLNNSCNYVKTERSNQNPKRYPFLFSKSLQYEIFSSLHSKYGVASQRDVLDHYLSSFFNAWLDYQELYRPQKRFVVGFCPRAMDGEQSYSRFRNDYPDGFLISVVREPVNWYLSAIKHGFLERHGNSIEEVMNLWMNSTQNALSFYQEMPSKTLLVSFTKLVSEPQTVMKTLCDKLDLEYVESMIHPSFNGFPMESNSHFKPVVGRVDSSVLASRGETNLSKVEIEFIRSNTQVLYEEFLNASLI